MHNSSFWYKTSKNFLGRENTLPTPYPLDTSILTPLALDLWSPNWNPGYTAVAVPFTVMCLMLIVIVLVQWNSQRTSKYLAKMARCISDHSYCPKWWQGNWNIHHGNSSCTVRTLDKYQDQQRIAVGSRNVRWYRCHRYIAIMLICWPIIRPLPVEAVMLVLLLLLLDCALYGYFRD